MNAFRPEAQPSLEAHEGKPTPASIRLEFFRHDAKAKEATAGAREGDMGIRLTPEGRQHATEVGKTKDPQPETSISYGSPRERSQETALRHMLANEEGITGDTSLEDIRKLVGSGMEYGKKDLETSRLDFDMDKNKEFHDVAFDHYLQKKDFLPWLHSESDELARTLSDKEDSTYSRMAGNVAELVDKYVKIFPRWQEIVKNNKDKPEKYAQFNNELQRYLGSHQGVTESFLMKVIEKADGPTAVEDFISSLDSKNGFGFSEGFSVEITGEENPQLTVRFRDKEWQVSPELIHEIIRERDEFDEGMLSEQDDAVAA